jgi:hypothetical protein
VALVFFGALVVVFCALVRHTAKLVLGTPAAGVPPENPAASGVVAMDLMLAALAVFSVWLPGPIWDLLQQAARVLGGVS